MKRREMTWRDLASEIVLVDGQELVPASVYAEFLGRQGARSDRFLDENNCLGAAPKGKKDDVRRAFLWAGCVLRGVEADVLNRVAKGVGPFGLTDLGRFMFEAELKKQ